MVVVDNPVQTKLRADAKAKEEEIRADTTTPAASLAKLTEAVMAQGKKDEDLSRAVRDSMASRGGGDVVGKANTWFAFHEKLVEGKMEWGSIPDYIKQDIFDDQNPVEKRKG